MNDYHKVKVCIFDFDGTLVDTMQHFADLAGSIIEREYQISFEKARELYLETSGIPFFQQLEHLFPDRSENPGLVEEFETKKKKLFFSERFSNDTKKSMSKLKENGFLIAISSNNFQNLVDQFMEGDNIQFDYVLGFENGFAKGKEHFNYIEKQTNCLADELLFVGDSLKDGEKAMEHGTQFIAKVGTFSKELFCKKFPNIKTVEKLEELIGILE